MAKLLLENGGALLKEDGGYLLLDILVVAVRCVRAMRSAVSVGYTLGKTALRYTMGKSEDKYTLGGPRNRG